MLNLVPEEQVVLAELEVLKFQLFNDWNAHTVEQCKDPAAT